MVRSEAFVLSGSSFCQQIVQEIKCKDRFVQVTPAVNKAPAASSSRVNSSPQPLTTLNLSSAVSIVPASQARVSIASKAPPGKRSNCFWSLSTSFCVLFTLSDYLLAISFSAGYGIIKL